MNHTIFFPPYNSNILTIFIAWINLDIGIQSCFYNGMDGYTLTWLQFLFPIYIWTIIIFIILLSWRYQIAVRLIGKNAVKVLATLILLSYTKLLCTIIVVLSFTYIIYLDKATRYVWLYDGNIDLLVCSSSCVSVVPSSAVHSSIGLCSELAGQVRVEGFLLGEQAEATLWCLHWTLPGQASLLDRIPATGSQHSFVSFCIQHTWWSHFKPLGHHSRFTLSYCVLFGVFHPVYKKRYCNILEFSFYLNLGAVSVATLYVRANNGNQAAMMYTSTSVALSTFVGTVLFHVYGRVK